MPASPESLTVTPRVTTGTASQFNLSPLVRLTLLLLYTALTVPLPFLARVTQQPVSPAFLWIGIGLGATLLLGVLSERVVLDEVGIRVCYSAWFHRITGKGWSLPWAEIQSLKARTTGQGGWVYYFVTPAGQAYLLPMRVAGFAELVRQVQAKTGIDTTSVRPLAQPWMYFILLGCAGLLLLVDAWTISTALSLAIAPANLAAL